MFKGPIVADSELWVQRTSPSTVVVRRGMRIVLSLIDDGEVARIGRELRAIAVPEPDGSGGDSTAPASNAGEAGAGGDPSTSQPQGTTIEGS
jgi:hypothetical protein